MSSSISLIARRWAEVGSNGKAARNRPDSGPSVTWATPTALRSTRCFRKATPSYRVNSSSDRDRSAAPALGEVDLPERAVLRLEVLGRDDLAGKRVSDRTDPVERPMHELADRARRDPLRGSVDGDDPAGVYQVRL